MRQQVYGYHIYRNAARNLRYCDQSHVRHVYHAADCESVDIFTHGYAVSLLFLQ